MDICCALTSEINIISLWLKILRKYFRKSIKKNIINAILNLESVNKGLKACFLWDVCGSVDGQSILRLINSLKDNGLLHEDLHIITISGETLVSNCKTLKHLVDTEVMERFKFVNISDNLKNPELIASDTEIGKEIFAMLCSVTEEIKEWCNSLEQTGLPSILHIHAKEDWCVPTILGVLLAYPVVYWHRKDAFETGSCLSFTPLSVYKIRASHNLFPLHPQFVLYSFSVPESVLMKCKVHVENWFIGLAQGISLQKSFINLNKEIKSVVHSSIIL